MTRPRHLLHTLPAAPTSRERLGREARVTLATLGSLAAAGSFGLMVHDIGVKSGWIPVTLLALAALLLHHGAIGSQLLARSAWWANLVLGTLFSVAGSGSERQHGIVMVLGTGAALLVMGRLGLDEREGSAFRPVAFRTTLTLGMIMAVADTQALAFLGAVQAEKAARHTGMTAPSAAALFLSSAVLAIAVAGLYRLRVWGLLLAALGSAAVGVMAALEVYGFDGIISGALVATSAVQVALAVPVFVAIVRRRAPAPIRDPFVRLAPALLVVGLMMVSVCLGFWHD